jgi:hypothetical protein
MTKRELLNIIDEEIQNVKLGIINEEITNEDEKKIREMIRQEVSAILPTPSGNILKELLKAGILLGISSRGMGSVEPLSGGKVQVGEDFELIGWDFVSNPSTHGAFMTPMNESVNKVVQQEVCNEWCKSQDLMREIITELS